ncbi:interferon-induced, double-stranded RNA-activated protein kinase isoform X2 [Hyla sarda]|uniref:interferon-induced, double-stranded RNA-activated protein kinase isoform X2 n=1 Tax=Hyla sarda TaxID=327740 RepID=UPI0024C24D6D|nr:interferon-induced, double-stranded RNA-activated protein kinase isoform X2 [Hyla sarda]
MEEQNYKGMLINHCFLSGLTYRFNNSRTGPSHDPRFTAYAFVNEEVRGEGQDRTKKAAENLACKMALLSLQNKDQKNIEAAQPAGNPASLGNPVALNIRDVASPSSLVNGAASNIMYDVNYVGLFNEFCQRNKCLDASFVDTRRGLSHMPEFFCHALIGQRKFPEATGKNKKEAKKNAAQLALKVLKPEYLEDLQLQRIPGLDDIEEAKENNSKSESSEDTSASAQKTENEPLQSESSDFQITFRSSATGTPSGQSRPQRRIELAANFTNLEPVSAGGTTQDTIFLRDFDDIKSLDSGGYGKVYKARKKLDQKYYVVKEIKWRSEKDVNEIQTLAQLEHKNIVRYYHSWAGEDFIQDSSSSGRHKVKALFIQMEFCANGTLEKWIKTMKTIDKCKSLNIFRQIIDGVEYIHSNNLIHRDLKENATYENEVDIFPLGLILIELFWKFDFKYKYLEWEKLRNAELPQEFVQQFPTEESMIRSMLSKEPTKRPKASYLKQYFEEKSIYYSKTR